jgi:hypothetical protein
MPGENPDKNRVSGGNFMKKAQMRLENKPDVDFLTFLAEFGGLGLFQS